MSDRGDVVSFKIGCALQDARADLANARKGFLNGYCSLKRLEEEVERVEMLRRLFNESKVA